MKNSIKTEWKIKFNFCICVILFCCKTISAQDTLTLVTGANLIVNIKEVNEEYVLFTLWPDSTNITKLPLDRVHSTSYKGANSNLFYLNPIEEKMVLDSLPVDSVDIEAMARSDAKANYTNSRGSGAGTFFATVFATPIIGTFVALGVSATPPAENKLNPPNKSLFKNPIYYNAYRKEAHKIKQRRVWTGFGIGVAVEAVIIGILVHEASQMEVY